MTDQKKVQEQGSQKISRRNVLKAAMAAGGAAALGFPNIVKAQGVTTMRWQSTWPSKDIFHEYALDYAKKVNDMTGGDLKIEVLPAGAVVPAFGLLDAVSKGVLDGGHGVLVYHYGKQTALALWGSGPGFGMDALTLLSWHNVAFYNRLMAEARQAIREQRFGEFCQVRLARCLERRIHLYAVQRARSLLPAHRSLLYLALDVPGDGLSRLVERRAGHVEQRRVPAMLGKDMGDAVAHRARAHHGDPHARPTNETRAVIGARAGESGSASE